MFIDLHCHSNRSDGTDTPRVVAERAAARGVRLFCLTDHDTWAGFEDTTSLGPEVEVVRGMELSCVAGGGGATGGRTVHLLCYGMAPGPALDRVADTVAGLQARRRSRIEEICARLARWNIHLEPDAVWRRAAGAIPGRPHVAMALVDAKVVRTVREAFDRFLRDGGPATVPAPRLEVTDALALVRPAGARVALAHPHQVGAPSVIGGLLRAWREQGLEGIEAVYGAYRSSERASWMAVADELGLVVTAGSDYHGVSVVPEVAAPGIELPAPRVARLLGWLNASAMLHRLV